MPLRRIFIESYEKSFCSTITNQRETSHNIHQSEKKWCDFLLASNSAFLFVNTLPPCHFPRLKSHDIINC